MRLIVRGYGDGKLVLEEKLETTFEKLMLIAKRQLETICAYDLNQNLAK